MRVALLGTGLMGAPMGRNLVAAGHEVHAWNRTRERAEGVDGATVHDTPAEACAGAEVVVTMLSDGDAVAQAMDGVELDGAVWAQMSTIGVEASERLARGAFVDAPVLGSTPAAEQGALTVLASGPFERCRPIFDAVGKTIDLGPEPGTGQRMKLVLNHWVLALTESVAETVLLAERLGVEPQPVLRDHRGWSDVRALCEAQGDEHDRALLRAELLAEARAQGCGADRRRRRGSRRSRG